MNNQQWTIMFHGLIWWLITVLYGTDKIRIRRFSQPFIRGCFLYTDPSIAIVTSSSERRSSITAVVIETKSAARCDTTDAICWTIFMSDLETFLKPFLARDFSVKCVVPRRLSLQIFYKIFFRSVKEYIFQSLQCDAYSSICEISLVSNVQAFGKSAFGVFANINFASYSSSKMMRTNSPKYLPPMYFSKLYEQRKIM